LVGIRRRFAAFFDRADSQRPPAHDPGGEKETQAIAALANPALSERRHLDAVSTLMTYGTDQSVGSLREALAWTDHMRVRHAAVMALGRIGSPSAVDAIIASLAFCDAISASRAARVLRVRNERRAVPALVAGVVERGEELGAGASETILRQLCFMPSPETVEVVAPLLCHRNRKIRRQAADAIGAVGGTAALAALEAAAADLGWLRGRRAGSWVTLLRKKAEPDPETARTET
jgi:HEAT repeat protein